MAASQGLSRAASASEFGVEVRDLIGKPFRFGGRGPDYYDCYGLVREIMARRGIEVPDYTSPTKGAQIIAAMLSGRVSWQQVGVRPHCVALIRLPASMHVGYMLRPDLMIHAWERSGGVLIERMPDWKHRIVGFYDYDPRNK
jgi:cell wall-associated NlpC family hydrolase